MRVGDQFQIAYWLAPLSWKTFQTCCQTFLYEPGSFFCALDSDQLYHWPFISWSKRITSGISALIGCRDGRPSFALGLPCAHRIPSGALQAVLNIVRNAMQAITENGQAEPGRIILQTRALRQFTIGHKRHRLVCHLRVIDNGPGIPPALLDSIFYPMVSGRADGTGLGLSITQNIISQHQGLIECESSPGRTQFNLFLPLDQNSGA